MLQALINLFSKKKEVVQEVSLPKFPVVEEVKPVVEEKPVPQAKPKSQSHKPKRSYKKKSSAKSMPVQK